ncbi:uncharacterized protein ELE39_003422 [Cryptosporidium sp. chipmunk genotype I]|uniref:uncharacterized protein n=1 Tax=Cryptosporidium sp. chipmunk genotype I TaxID=1280935 RepID=UPI00351A58C5|nr:hypothetical protein ELE39_003422 [Cryptosporidium sp. chipmunk genotype I]
MKDHGESIKDELQAYYGDEILVNNSELITINNTFGNNAIEDDHILNIDFSQKDIDIDEIFNDILKTKTIKDLFLIRKELNKKIQECQIEMQKFVHSNYKKLQFISNLLDKNILVSNSGNSNEQSSLNSIGIINDVENNKNIVNEKFQEIKKNVFTSENNKNLEKYLNQCQLFAVISELKNFNLILEDYFSKQDYELLMQIYNKWKKPLEMLSNDDYFKVEFQEILRKSNEIFEKTINTLKKQILVNINKNSILPNINIIIKSYTSLNNEQIDFTNDLILNINNLFQDIVNEIVVRQLEILENSQINDKLIIFSNTCKQSYQEIFIPLNFIISELSQYEIDPLIPSSILKNLFEVTFIKIIELLGHVFNYEKKNPKYELNIQPVLQGFEYITQAIKELLKTLSLTNFHKHPSFSSEKFKYIVFSAKNNTENENEVDDEYCYSNDNIIKRKYIEWKKSILSDFLKFENFDLSIKEIWNDLFDFVITLQNTDIDILFVEINKHIFNKLIYDELYNIIKNYKELIKIDFEICENLVRKMIKDIFQSIISNSILHINSIFFDNIINNNFDLNSIENFKQLIEKMHLELKYSLNGNDIFDLNNQDWIIEKFSLVNYKQKAIYLLSIIIMIRYLRDNSLPTCISYFHNCFYDNNNETKNLMNNIGLLDLFNSDKIKYESPTNFNNNNNFHEDDATTQIVRILYNRFENLFLNIFVIWNIYAIIQEIYDQFDFKNGEKIHIDEFIDLIHFNIINLFKFCNTLFQPQFQNFNFIRKSAISELQFPIKNSEKSQIFAKWSNNYYILKNFDLDSTKVIFNKPISFWFSQILHGILIETIFLIKNNNFIVTGNVNSFEKSLSKFWNSIKHFFEYDLDLNITHALFCQLYNTLSLNS